MIEGMEILKQTEITEKELSEFWWVWLVAGIAVAGGLIILACWTASRERYENLAIISFVFLVMFCLLIVAGIILACREVETPSGKYEYEVIFDDTTLLKEVYERYEIVDVKGDIYILRDFEPVENICSNCNSAVDEEGKLCPECGTKR